MAFKDRLKEARLACGLTQEKLALQIDVAKSTYTGYERGNSEPNLLTIQKIMRILNVDANYLWQDEIPSTQAVISLNEREHINIYLNLDLFGKDMVDTVIKKEYERVQKQSELNTQKKDQQ